MSGRIRGSFLWFLVLLVVWEALAKSGIFPPQALPDLEHIAASFGDGIVHGQLLSATLVSLAMVIAGIAAGALAAFVLASLSFRFSSIRHLTDMLTAVLHPLPGIALLPVCILFFGIGPLTLEMVVLHSVIWPLLVNIRAGFTSVAPVYRKIGQNYSLSPPAFFFRIMLPASFSHIFAGLRTAWARAWRSAVSAEMIFGIAGTGGGLGWFIYSKRIFMDSAGLYGGILMLALMGIAVESGLFSLIESRTLVRWGQK